MQHVHALAYTDLVGVILGRGADPYGVDFRVRDDVHRITRCIRYVVLRCRSLNTRPHRHTRGDSHHDVSNNTKDENSMKGCSRNIEERNSHWAELRALPSEVARRSTGHSLVTSWAPELVQHCCACSHIDSLVELTIQMNGSLKIFPARVNRFLVSPCKCMDGV